MRVSGVSWPYPYREVPLNRSCRAALEEWLAARGERAVVGERALFLGPRGVRLSPRSVDRVVRGVAEWAGLRLSAHVLRHRPSARVGVRSRKVASTNQR